MELSNKSDDDKIEVSLEEKEKDEFKDYVKRLSRGESMKHQHRQLIDLPGTSNETQESLLNLPGVEEKEYVATPTSSTDNEGIPNKIEVQASDTPIGIEDLPMQSRRTSRRKSLHEISNENLHELKIQEQRERSQSDSGAGSPDVRERDDEFSQSMKHKIFGSADAHPEDSPVSTAGNRNLFSRSWSKADGLSPPGESTATPSPLGTGSSGRGADTNGGSDGAPNLPPKKVHRVSLENVAKGHPLFQRMSRKKSAVTLLKERSTSEPRGLGNNKKVLVPHTTDQAKEILFHDAEHGRILNPHCWVRKLVDYIIIAAVIYTMFAVPIAAGFGGNNDNNGGRQRFTGRVIAELALDGLFLMDVVLEFFTAVYDVRAEGYILDKGIVRDGYMNTYFYYDLFGSLPIELVIWPLNIHYRDVIRLCKIVRCTRLRNISRGTQSVLGRLQSHLFRLLKVIAEFLWLSHIIACLFFGLARLEGGRDSWIYVMHIEDDTVVTQYLQSMFYSVTLTTGIGNTPVPPQTDWETIYVILAMIAGAGFWAYVMGIMFDLVSSLNRVQNSYEHDLDQLSYWMDHKRVPNSLKDLVYRQFKFQHTMTRGINDADILSKLSPALQTRLRRFLCRDIVATVPIFKGGSASFIDAIVTLLKPRFVITGDVICSQNEVGSEMYVIARGRVEVLKQRPTNLMGGRTTLTSAYRLTVLEKGSFFGEISLLYEQPRLATCRALTPCDLFTLSKGDFESVMLQHPDELRKMNLVATQRHQITTEMQEKMNKLDAGEELSPADLAKLKAAQEARKLDGSGTSSNTGSSGGSKGGGTKSPEIKKSSSLSRNRGKSREGGGDDEKGGGSSAPGSPSASPRPSAFDLTKEMGNTKEGASSP